MKTIILISFLFSIALAFSIMENSEEKKDWWETGQFYQIYPRSFKDSDGDGIGDLNGITSKLQYLKDIGITAAWLSPIFKSPMADFGYDISDFYSIQPEYGTMEDFENLIQEANKVGIKIILDFVPNHSSDENEWFINSVNRVRGYEDFYIWHDGYEDPKNPSKRLPPSNWLATFRGSAWEWNDKRKQFYYHKFAVKQPDLNYRNPAVVEQMKHVLRFWLNKGVAGFRVDMIPTLFEKINPDGSFPNEPLSNTESDPENPSYLTHIYTEDQPENLGMIYEWRELLDEYKRVHGGDTRVFLAETYSPLSVIRQYYGKDGKLGAHIPFNFLFITQANSKSKAEDFNKIISSWLEAMPKRFTPNWVIGNHDQRRVGSRLGEEKIDMVNMMLMVLPGASVTYNGEEIGMLDGNISWEDSRDPAACNSNPEIYEQFTRDPARTPFQWDDSRNGGFSTASKTWLPMADNYKTVNVKNELTADRSHLKVFMNLTSLRKRKVLQYGSLRNYVLRDSVLVLERRSENEKTIYFLGNFSNEKVNVNLSTSNTSNSAFSLKYLIVSVASSKSIGDTVTSDKITLDAYESIILEKIN